MPFSLIPKKAQAQNISGYGGVGLGAAVSSLPLCKDAISSSMSGLFSGISSLFDNTPGYNSSDIPDLESLDFKIDPKTGLILDDVVNTANKDFSSVDVNIEGTDTALRIKRIDDNTQATNKAVTTIKNNDTCLQSIGKLLIKLALQKITLSTVDWINSGFEGSPTFLQDRTSFYKDIAKNEILEFGVEISGISPFSKEWLRNQALAYDSKFAKNASYSLDELIRKTNPEFSAVSFREDFSKGGWDAWSYLTQVPANNPLGFQLMASNELQKRLAGTEQSRAQDLRDALQEANGFLGDERCVDSEGKPNGITRAQYAAALRETPPRKICDRWEYVTPGKLVAEAATNAISYPQDWLLSADDLNDAVASILDAILSHFSNKWMTEGFASLGDQYSASSGLTYTGAGPSYESQVEKDFSPVHLTSSWLSSHPNFNIRTDLTQALVDEQRTYIDKLKAQNKELLSTTDGKTYNINKSTGLSNAYGLLPAIYQLDYCIPGPHPGWENDSRNILAAGIGKVLPETQQSLEDLDLGQVAGKVGSYMPAVGAAIGATVFVTGAGTSAAVFGVVLGSTFAPIIGSVIGLVAGLIVSFFTGLFGGDSSENVRAYYAAGIGAFTGFVPDYQNQNDDRTLNISSKSGMNLVLNEILSRYIDIMKKTYFAKPGILPYVAKEASSKFNLLNGYGQMLKDNEDRIASLEGVVKRLGDIKTRVDLLNGKLAARTFLDENGEIGEDQEFLYEKALQEEIRYFGRISSEMVDGNDIASTDNILGQIVDEKEYVYNQLIKGPGGCEADLEKPQEKFPWPFEQEAIDKVRQWDNFDATSVKRMTYPFPIFYDYNALKGGDPIPDPWESGYTNNMPSNNTANVYGPGFLSFVLFDSEGTPVNGIKGSIMRRGPERLRISDLVPQSPDPDRLPSQFWNVSVGSTSAAGINNGVFENIIGIY